MSQEGERRQDAEEVRAEGREADQEAEWADKDVKNRALVEGDGHRAAERAEVPVRDG